MNIFVANLSFRIQSEDLKEIFGEYGEISSAKVVMDRDTNKSKGFGFVEMPDDETASKAINELDGAEVDGKTIVVKKANPKPASSGGGGGGGQRRPYSPSQGRGGNGGNGGNGGGYSRKY